MDIKRPYKDALRYFSWQAFHCARPLRNSFHTLFSAQKGDGDRSILKVFSDNEDFAAHVVQQRNVTMIENTEVANFTARHSLTN